MAGRPKSPLQRRNGVNFVQLSFDDGLPCQLGQARGTSGRRPRYGSVSDLGLCAAKLSVAEDQGNRHDARKWLAVALCVL